MRVIRAIVVVAITILVIYLLDNPHGSLPALGRLLDPVNGWAANAEPVNKDFSQQLNIKDLKGSAKVWFDDRMVPHIHADNDHDLYFLQGYVHAYFRLWQMDMQTRAAAGRVSEVVGAKALRFDRTQRRKGMVYAAENSLGAMMQDPRTKEMLDAYTAGVNQYIATLHTKDYPLEYKLMGFVPEKWTSLKCALLMKYMADDLTGQTDDIALTALRDMLPPGDLDLLFPDKVSGSTPVIPSDTPFDPPSLQAPNVPTGSIWLHFTQADFGEAREDGKGSNNWALSGSRTKSGAAILCNDPHLGLNLPSLWYEVQLQEPGMNAYGVSLPGAPGIVLGFNDSLSWGFTNNYRDVKDFYTVNPVAGTSNSYWFGGARMTFNKRVEKIQVKGQKDFMDTVLYTVQGSVMYDASFHGPNELKRPLAMCWMAHRATNELLALYLMNRADSYMEFVDAIMNFQCPAQNIIYADRGGNIAIWGQGQFINKWKDQGKFIMNGADTTTMWGDLIPMRENPHAFNPSQGYLSSANESVTDSTYPYWYNGPFKELRAWRINQVLDTMHQATVQDMFALQNDSYSILAAGTLPMMLKALPADMDAEQKKYADMLAKWNYCFTADNIAATVYQAWWLQLYNDIWNDDFGKVPDKLWPLYERTMQLMQTDTAFKYFDDRNTPQVEHLANMIRRSYTEAIDSIARQQKKTGLEWYKVRNTTISHLTKLPAFSYAGIKTAGWGSTVDAMKGNHGPSWRMVVQMGKEIEAYGVYPGGQSGNPGSRYYANFLQHWADGQYYHLLFLPDMNTIQKTKDIKYTWSIQSK